MTERQALRSAADELLAMHEEGDLSSALVASEELERLAEAGDPADEIVRETRFIARFERALILTELGELEQAAGAYASAAATDADLTDPDQRHEVAMALLNRGICLDAIGDHAAALVGYDDLVARFGAAEDPVTRDQVIRGRVNGAAALVAVDRAMDAVAAADAVIAELDPSDALEAEQLAMAVRVRAAGFRALDRTAEAAAALAEVERCTDEDPATRSQVAAAHRERAEVLAELGRTEQAIALLDHTVERFRTDPDPIVAEALISLVETELVLLEASGDLERADVVRSSLGA